MIPSAAAEFRAGPRFRLVDSAPGPVPALPAQLRRALRILLRQGGGVMLLHACTTGASVRLDCSVSGSRATLELGTADEPTSAALRSACDGLVLDAAHLGVALVRVSCAGPASQPLLPAA